MWPLIDQRNPFEVLIPKLKAAAEKFDMVPQPQYKGVDPQPWDGSENILPGTLEPYYLQADKGPKSLVGGIVVKPMVTTKESAGKFAIGSIEGSSWHQNLALKSKLRFSESHHAFHVVEGQLDIKIDGSSSTVGALETVYVPKDSTFSITVASRFAKAYVFSSGAGLIEFLTGLGEKYEHSVLPEKEEISSADRLSQLNLS